MSPRITVRQFIRFAAVGVMNTAVDFLILNLLIVIFGLGRNDPKFMLFKGISFSIAVLNSFAWNKLWVFRRKYAVLDEKKAFAQEIIAFAIVSIFGLFIDIAVAAFIYTLGHNMFPELPNTLLANIGALVGTGVVLITNFLGYKFLVFKK